MNKYRKHYFILTFGLLVLLSFVVIPVALMIPPIKDANTALGTPPARRFVPTVPD